MPSVELWLNFHALNSLAPRLGLQHLGMDAQCHSKMAYTIEEAAGLLSISRAQIYRLIDSCQLNSVTVGRSRRITQGQLDVFVAQLEARSNGGSLHTSGLIGFASPRLRSSTHEQSR